MQYSKRIAIVAAFAGLANAQSQCLSSAVAIPPCALGYIASAAYSSYSCGLVDFACDCSNVAGIAGDAVPVFGQNANCSPIEVLNSAAALCSCNSQYAPASVTLDAVESACQASAAAIPACALGYLASAGAGLGCALNNFECQCSNYDAIQGSIVNDVVSVCGAASLTDVINSANALCSCVTANGAGPGTSPATATTEPSGAPSTSATPSIPISVPTVTGVSLSAPSIPISLSLPTGTGSASGSASGAATGAQSGSASGSDATTSKATTAGISVQGPSGSDTMVLPTFTGAGATASAFGGLFGVVAGLVAFL